jgi:hypothetical protein
VLKSLSDLISDICSARSGRGVKEFLRDQNPYRANAKYQKHSKCFFHDTPSRPLGLSAESKF